MCSINGILKLDGSAVVREIISNMSEAMIHRGPDGSGLHIDPTGVYGTAHRRLSIIDLSEAGSQPFLSDDGRYILTYNGEVFNYLELREELVLKGHLFATDTDTEVVLKSFIEWGEECLHKFNGMWALAIWDCERQRLFVARDRFGIKPLYYLLKSGEFAYASETKAFKEHSTYSREINGENLRRSLISPYAIEGVGRTIFTNIKSLLAGHAMWVDASGEVRMFRWWNTLDYSIAVPEGWGNKVALFKDLATDATKLRLRSDVNIGTALSGGLDSSSVFGLVQLIAKGDGAQLKLPDSFHKAFIASFPGTSQDETDFALAVADMHTAPRTVFSQESIGLVDRVIDSTLDLDAIYSTPIIVASDIYLNMRQEGVSVSMDGHGVDEYMYGYNGLQLVAAREALQNGDVSRAREFLAVHNGMVATNNILTWTRFTDESNRNTKLALFSKFRNRVKGILGGNRWFEPMAIEPLEHHLKEVESLKELSERKLYLQFHRSMLPAILRNFDIASMKHGVESRAPFMDHRLVALMFKLSVEAKMGSGVTKRLLRESMRGLIPEEVRTRTRKTGLNAPLSDWFAGPMLEYVQDTLASKSFLNSDHWNGESIRASVMPALQGVRVLDDHTWSQFWSVLNAHIILDNSK